MDDNGDHGDDNDDIERIRSTNRENVERERRNVREDNINSRRRELASANRNSRANNRNYISPFEGIRADEFGNSSILSYIKNYLIKDEDNIDAFFKIPGALHALVGQFTGNDPARHLLAVECLCNLSLGPPKCCYVITRAAGTYLLTFLDSANIKIVEVCAWTLGNLSSNNLKISTLLKTQGFLDKMIPMTHPDKPMDHQHAAFYALGHFVSAFPKLLSKDEKVRLITSLGKHPTHLPDYALKVLFIFSVDTELEENFMELRLYTKVTEQMVDIVKRVDWHVHTVNLDCVLKILANLSCQSKILEPEISPLLNEDYKFTIVKLLTCRCTDLKIEACWLFGNILNTSGESSPWKAKYLSFLEHAQRSILPTPIL